MTCKVYEKERARVFALYIFFYGGKSDGRFASDGREKAFKPFPMDRSSIKMIEF